MRDFKEYDFSPNDKILSDSLLIFEKQLQTNEGVDVVIDNVPCRALIYNHLNDLNEFKEERVISCKKDIMLHRGSIVIFEKETYIVTSDVDDHIVYLKAKMQKTNDYLIYALNYKTTNEKVFKIPAIINNQTLYTDGIKEGKLFNLGDTMMSCTVGISEDTIHIQDGMRFIFDRNGEKIAYKVCYIDTTTRKGLLSCTLKESNDIKPEDNLQDRIAYNEIKNTNDSKPVEPNNPTDKPTKPTNPMVPTYSIQGSDTIDSKIIQAYTIVGQNNSPVSDKEFEFSFEKFDYNTPSSLYIIKGIGVNSISLLGSRINGEFILKAVCKNDKSIIIKKNIKVVR